LLILGENYNISFEDLRKMKSKFGNIDIINVDINNNSDLIFLINDLIKKNKYKIVVINFSENISCEIIKYLNNSDVTFYSFSEFMLKFLNKCNLEFYCKSTQISNTIKNNKINSFFKRIFDILFSIIAIILLSPLYLLIFLLIKLMSPSGKVIYSHIRIGKNGEYIKVYKFRTMVPNADKILEDWLNKHPIIKKEYKLDFKLKYDPRIIPKIGNILRKLSLDELPQFFNSLKGDLSIVGPRPITEEEIEKYGQNILKLYSVKPGITGLWQVSGRNNLTYEERVSLDMEYINNNSIFKDMKIIIKTIYVVLLQKGAY